MHGEREDLANQVKVKRKNRKDSKGEKKSLKRASGKCQKEREAIGKATSKVARGHALQKFMACKRGK